MISKLKPLWATYQKCLSENNDLKVRLVGMPLVALGVTIILVPVGSFVTQNTILAYTVHFIFTFFLWNSARYLSLFLQAFWPTNSIRGLLRLMVYNVVVTSATAAAISYGLVVLFNRFTPIALSADTSVKAGVLANFVVIMVHIAAAFFRYWKQSLLEAEALKRAQLSQQFNSLKEQLSPHFLFNNLNTLTALIEEAPKQAVHYVLQLSQVYRYILASQNQNTIPLSHELVFLNNYLALHQLRVGPQCLQFSNQLPNWANNTLIPPLTLQILVENAIKHNQITPATPLKITLSAHQTKPFFSLVNNLVPLTKPTTGTGTGLKNIRMRYKLLHLPEPEFTQTDTHFMASISYVETT